MTLNVSLDNIKQMQQKVEFEDNNTPVQRCAAGGGGDGDTSQGWESKLKQVDRRISVNAPTILIILNEILTVNTPVSTMQQSPNVYLNWLALQTFQGQNNTKG